MAKVKTIQSLESEIDGLIDELVKADRCPGDLYPAMEGDCGCAFYKDLDEDEARKVCRQCWDISREGE